MKIQITCALALSILLPISANITRAVSTDETIEEICRAWVLEQQSSEEDFERNVAECIASELEAQEQDVLEEECRTWATEQQTPEDELENVVAECIVAELEAREKEKGQKVE